jgi:hypothetical protein
MAVEKRAKAIVTVGPFNELNAVDCLNICPIEALAGIDEARRVTFHCAQVLSLYRRYISGTTCEPFNIFHTGLSLWLVAPLPLGELALQRGFERRSHTRQHRSTSSTELHFSQA